AISAGVPDARWGQVPVALVVFHAGKSLPEDELKAFCLKHLADYKVPKRIRVAAELPLTGAGKLDRNALGTMFA
ncbi:MAG TPA: long-chain fatty acid--CoA ligase, partial [Rhodospirillales bacterium]|nr:long-chain fatty acid--CoA ligase [Rhodospirillales bacterium]